MLTELQYLFLWLLCLSIGGEIKWDLRAASFHYFSIIWAALLPYTTLMLISTIKNVTSSPTLRLTLKMIFITTRGLLSQSATCIVCKHKLTCRLPCLSMILNLWLVNIRVLSLHWLDRFTFYSYWWKQIKRIKLYYIFQDFYPKKFTYELYFNLFDLEG